MIPDFPINIRIRLAELKFFLLLPDVANSLPCWLAQFCWASQQGKKLAKSGSNKMFFQFCQSYSYVNQRAIGLLCFHNTTRWFRKSSNKFSLQKTISSKIGPQYNKNVRIKVHCTVNYVFSVAPILPLHSSCELHVQTPDQRTPLHAPAATVAIGYVTLNIRCLSLI